MTFNFFVTYLLCVKGECDSLTGSHLISGLITVACSHLNEESRVSRVPTLATHGGVINVAPKKCATKILRADRCYFGN